MRRFALVAALLAVVASGCGRPGTAEEAGKPVAVLAAASLTDAFEAVAKEFERAEPGHKVELSFGSSSSLATQIENGAPADVFASADEKNMTRLVDADLVTGPKPFVGNELRIVVPSGNPKKVTGLADLAKPDMVIAMAAPAVPAGRVAREAFEAAGVPVPDASEEPDVRSALNKVVLGEADAALVWATDVLSGGDKVEGIELPADLDVGTTYPIGVVRDGPNADGAKAFVEFVLSPEGRRILTEHGFTEP